MFVVTTTPRHEARLTVKLHILVEHPIPVYDHISLFTNTNGCVQGKAIVGSASLQKDQQVIA